MPFEKGEIPEGAKPFKPGQSGNPNGRPKKLPELDKLLADVLGEDKDGIEAAKAILMALRAKATKGDVRAAEVLLDRAYGKAKETINMNHSGGVTMIWQDAGEDSYKENEGLKSEPGGLPEQEVQGNS